MSRYVGREIKRLKDESTLDSLRQSFAAMPPLSALKLILSMAVSSYLPNLQGEMVKQRPKCIALIDVKRAQFWAYATRELYVELPEEYEADVTTHVGKLLRSLYGSQDASRNWELEIRRVMTTCLEFKQGRSNPCLNWNEKRDIKVEVH